MHKKTLISFYITIFFFSLSCCHINTKKDVEKVLLKNKWPQVIEYAQKNLPKHGILVQQKDGYAYLKVDDNYIHQLFERLNILGFKKPPYFRRKNSPGAHISVVYKDENVKLKEIGQKFSFKLKDIILISGVKHDFIVLRVSSPELKQLRRSYGLSSLLNNHSFHITLAKHYGEV
jgi:uncharacterized protein YehS (DUF1456 family)